MSDTASKTAAEWRPRANPWLIALAVMLATFMVILDTSIVVVALPYIAGNLGATQDESTWVLTSYLVANAIILPASTWFSGFFGRKRFLISCTVIFTVASLLCGLATSMGMLVIFSRHSRCGWWCHATVVAGHFAGKFPSGQTRHGYRLVRPGHCGCANCRPHAGWMADGHWSWRWTFYINLPVGILAFFLMSWVVEDPPYIRAKGVRRFDGMGFGLVALCLGTLQVVLDKGQDADWFSAIWIRWFTVICVLSLIGFIVRQLWTDAPLVDLHVFKNRNFAVSCVLFALYGMMIYALITIQPLFVQSLLGYNAFNAGLSVSPRGFGAFAALFFVGPCRTRLMRACWSESDLP